MNKNTLLLLGAAVILGAIAYVLMQQPGEQSITASEGESLFHIDSANVDKIKIDSPGSSLILTKQGVEWRIENPLSARASQTAVGSLLLEAGSSRIKAMVSDKPAKHSIFQVDSTGIVLTFYKQDVKQASVVIGKQGPGYSDIYVRTSNSNEVYLIDEALSRSARRSLKDWRDPTIVSIPRESFKEIRFQYGDTTFAVSWLDSVWLIGRSVADEVAVNSLLGSLSNLQADDFIDTPLLKPNSIAAVTFAGIQLRFFQTKGSETIVVQSSASPQLFELQSWRAHQILKRKKDLLKAPS